jgi:hypothetical protein
MVLLVFHRGSLFVFSTIPSSSRVHVFVQRVFFCYLIISGIIATLLLLFINMYIIILAINKYVKLFKFKKKKHHSQLYFQLPCFILHIFL